MLSKIALFELRYQLRAPLFYVAFALFFLLSFGSVVIDEIRIGGRGNVNFNSPYAILQTLAILNVFGIFVVTAFVASAVIRDDETGFAAIIRSTRINKLDYLVGRFAGAVAVAFLVMASVPLGMLVGSWMPWVDAEKIGPFVLSNYLYALFVYSLPTLLVIGAGFFALATATRSMMWTYVGAVAFLALFFMSRVLLRDASMDTLSGMIDPFGIGTLSQATKYWTATERNTQLPAVAGVILYNRLLWIAVGAALFALAFAIFRFEVRGDTAGAAIMGDAARLATAFHSIFRAVLREQPAGCTVIAERRLERVDGVTSAIIVVAEAAVVQGAYTPKAGPFDEKRGGLGLALPLARRVIEGHGGRILSPETPDGVEDHGSGRGAAIISLPLRS